MNATELLTSIEELSAACAQITTTIARINASRLLIAPQPTAPAEPQKLLTAADLVDRLQISKSQAYQLLRSGDIATVHLGRSVRVTEEDLQAYLKSIRQEPARPWYERMAG